MPDPRYRWDEDDPEENLPPVDEHVIDRTVSNFVRFLDFHEHRLRCRREDRGRVPRGRIGMRHTWSVDAIHEVDTMYFRSLTDVITLAGNRVQPIVASTGTFLVNGRTPGSAISAI